ncbi:MAG: 4Fe-4S binding protein [Christensenellaceae bacterium]|jgi:ferredoxin|nr:4Fe-4S binding protein [Christensenellaceae bacterium]
MRIQRARLTYFSPTNTTRLTIRAIGEGSGLPCAESDFTNLKNAAPVPPFAPDELAVVGLPVYYGRVPRAALGVLRTLRGQQSPAVPVCVYGHRHFDDALAELEDILREGGFVPVAARAFLGEHSFSPKLAGGRPDAADLSAARAFGRAVAGKLEGAAPSALAPGAIPGSRPYRPFGPGASLAPMADERCASCGLCAKSCPVGAIDPSDAHRIDAGLCILCRACAKGCPSGAIDLREPPFWERVEALVAAQGAGRKEATLIL